MNSPRRGIGATSLSRLLAFSNTTGISIWDAASAPEQVPGLGGPAIKAFKRFMATMHVLRERTEATPPIAELLKEMVQETGSGSHWADRQILRRDRQINAALHLAGWLKQRFGIRMRDITGHAMANDSPYFKDLQGWRNDHTDWLRRDVRAFRHRLQRLLRR